MSILRSSPTPCVCTAPLRDHSRLTSSVGTNCTFKLPPYAYTIYLLDQFGIYLGHDWHWFRLRHFRRRLDNTYSQANSVESKDRIWLCQLLIVLALAESVNDAGRRPQSNLDLETGNSEGTHSHPLVTANMLPPGAEFFEQAMKLFHVPHETVSLEHIEALNLIVGTDGVLLM